jgi:CxxC-x17-CxxC domain-containing protein
MDDFRASRVRILVATNVAARGLDITHVEQVINFELPESHQLLTHRVGRTGRMGREGRAITLLNHEDGAKWRQLERGLGRRIPRTRWVGAAAALNDTPESVGVTEPVKASENGRGRTSQPSGQPRSNRAKRQQQPAYRQPEPARQELESQVVDSLLTPNGADQLSQVLERVAATGNDYRPRPQQRTATEKPAAKRSRNSNRSQSKGPRFEVECSACGTKTTVPFEPTNGRPVYCRPCYGAMRPDDSPARGNAADRRDIRSSGAETTYAD